MSRSDERRFIDQTRCSYPACIPIAVCNAARFFGLPSPAPDTRAFEDLIDFARCRHGVAITPIPELATHLGLVCEDISVDEARSHFPAALIFRDPVYDPYGRHAALAIDYSDERGWLLVNYRWKAGPTVEWIPMEPLHSRADLFTPTRRLKVETGRESL